MSGFLSDFRTLNNQTAPDMYPMGNIQGILHRAAWRGKLFAKLDCKDAFFQTLMKEEDIHKTAITTPLGLLEWVVMPQGIRNAPGAQGEWSLGLVVHVVELHANSQI